jgi:hypothetical protein
MIIRVHRHQLQAGLFICDFRRKGHNRLQAPVFSRRGDRKVVIEPSCRSAAPA